MQYQNCEERNRVLQIHRADNELERLIEDCRSLIHKYLWKNISFANSCQENFISISKPTPRLTHLGVERRVKELEGSDLVKVEPSLGNMVHLIKGIYKQEHGRVYLHKDHWCIESAIHETLHACSLMSMTGGYDRRYRSLYEGLTEFYTGFILYKAFTSCYESCYRSRSNMNCQITYEPDTKLWGALCRFIPISATFQIYFYNGSTDWQSLFANFISIINSKYKSAFVNPSLNFNNPLLIKGNQPMFELFKNECRKCFGSVKFDSIYGSLRSCTDYSKMTL